jgi:hypothetical protein
VSKFTKRLNGFRESIGDTHWTRERKAAVNKAYQFGLMLVLLVGVAYLALPLTVNAQSGSRIYPRKGVPAPEPFERKFWAYLAEANYRNWAPWPGQDGEFTKGKSPHGQQLKMYVNRTVAGKPGDPPLGSIIIKENFSADSSLTAITVMYRSKGFSEETKDWYWVKYNPDGAVALKDDTRLAGKVDSCIECHRGAKGDDYIFANDK